MTVDELLRSVRANLVARGSEEVRVSTLRFFKESIDCYGVSSPELKTIVRDIAPEVKMWNAAERNRFCTGLMKSGTLLFAPSSVDTANCGFTVGDVPPIAG